MRISTTLIAFVFLPLVGGCYESKFAATGTSLKALDAAGLSGAVLSNTPKDPSADTRLAIAVKNVDTYVYSLLDDAQDCSGASYSKEVSGKIKITDDIGKDSAKLICVRGSREGYALQTRPTEYRWVKDTVAPGEFALVGMEPISNARLGRISWSAAEGATAGYDIAISKSEDCKQVVVEEHKTKAMNFDASALVDGTYYVCLKAIDLAGNENPAANDRFKFTIDTVAPGPFNINRPYAKSNRARPVIAWSESLGSSAYQIQLGKDASCAVVVDQIEETSKRTWAPSVDLTEGDYYVCAHARDDAANVTVATNQGYKFNVDFSGVYVSFEDVPDDRSNAIKLATKVVNASWYRYKIVKAADAALCAQSAGYSQDRDIDVLITDDVSKYVDGERYAICAYGADDFSNWPTDIAKFVNKTEWTVDRTPPTLRVTAPAICGPQSSCKNNLIAVQVNAKDGNDFAAEIELSIVHSSGAVVVSRIVKPAAFDINVDLPVNKLTAGNYTVRGIAKDKAGNAISATAAFIFDNVAPSITLVEGARIKPASTGYGKNITNSRINIVNVNLTATDALTKVASVCFKAFRNENVTTVDGGDSCWFNVTPQMTVSLRDQLTKVGFIEFRYKIRAWARDEAGNVSAIDSANDVFVDYKPVKPPVLSFLYATNAAAENVPSQTNSVLSAVKSSLYIRWVVTPHVNSDGLLPKPIKLFYSTDGSDYSNAIVADIAADLKAPGCALSKAPDLAKREIAGCYLWSVPANLLTASYLSVRVVAEDKDGPVSYGQTNNINLVGFRFLAGNTETGFGATSTASILQPSGTQSLVVHPTGQIFLLDSRGLMTIDPGTGVMSRYINSCNTPGCNGLYLPRKIGLDFNNNLLIREQNRLTKINVKQGPASKITLAGGGTLVDDQVDNPLDLFMTWSSASHDILVAAPNGDLYFESDLQGKRGSEGARIRRLSNGKITSIKFAGKRTLWNWPATRQETIAECQLLSAAFDFNPAGIPARIFALVEATSDRFRGDQLCGVDLDSSILINDFVAYTFNPLTNQTGITDTVIAKTSGYSHAISGVREAAYSRYFQGMDGRLYARANGAGLYADRIYRYESGSNTWIKLAGGDNGGECRDTNIDDPQNVRDALNCSLNLSSIFVDQQSTVFMVDNNVIRVIDSNNEIITLAGESLSSGDGRNPLSARFNKIANLDFWKPANGPTKYVVSDVNFRIREFTENGTIEPLVGSGVDRLELSELDGGEGSTITYGNDAANASFSLEANGDLIMLRKQSTLPYRFKRASMQWESVRKTAAGVNVGFPSAGYGPHVLGSDGSNILFANFNWLSEIAKSGNGTMFELALDGSKDADFFLGKPIGSGRFPFYYPDMLCAEGTLRNNCNGLPSGFDLPSAYYDSGSKRWFIAANNASEVINGTPVAPAYRARIVSVGTLSNPDANANKIKNEFSVPNAPVVAFTIRTENTRKIAYACLNNGRLYRLDNVAGTQDEIAMPSASITCSSATRMRFDGNWLVFSYAKSALAGVAAIQLMPR